MEISARLLGVSSLCVDLQYDFIPLWAKKKRSTYAVVDGT
jgi:hypothetical protein